MDDMNGIVKFLVDLINSVLKLIGIDFELKQAEQGVV